MAGGNMFVLVVRRDAPRRLPGPTHAAKEVRCAFGLLAAAQSWRQRFYTLQMEMPLEFV